ncbi:class I SAM-dependent methyltransferase [Melioribacteraceae bacterium 4301-Me]|uniref:class I SAM-dependent methyltransferase n=1 Tax=Pyranulibacter aquaticus TaxID=3163344 RepID=UPI0035995DFE
MSKSEDYWKNLSKKIKDPKETKNKRPDTSDLEVEFISKYINPNTELLDLGSGTGLIINKLVDKVKHITAVEKFEGFSKFIIDHPNMLVINADLIGFKIRKLFDVVLCLGVAQCFPKEEMKGIYQNIYSMLRQNGHLVIRTHCGLHEDVIVDGFSQELGTEYFAEYRQVDKEKALLEEIGFLDIQIFDIFPDTTNVWENTRHFMFVCKKP